MSNRPDDAAEKVAPGPRDSWGLAAMRALAILVTCVLVFIVIPNWLVNYLSLRVTPTGRDFVLVAWFAAALVGASAVFVRMVSKGSG